MIIRHATTCNFSLDGFLFVEVGLDVIIGVALPRSVVSIHARHAQAIHEFVAPQLQIGSGYMLNFILRRTTALPLTANKIALKTVYDVRIASFWRASSFEVPAKGQVQVHAFAEARGTDLCQLNFCGEVFTS